jgi:membrane associated rhomboid family serine protease
MSGGAILVFILFVVGAVFVKNRFFEFDGAIDIAVSAGAGAVGGLIGAAIGMILFPKKGEKND